MPDARIEDANDILVRITTTNICGSDLHMYEGRTDMETGRILGHENMGQVIEIGDAVRKVEVGEYVVLAFNVACGHCKNCERGLTNYYLTMQREPSWAGAAYGFADMGPYQGGQAELLRVPFGDFNALRLGEEAAERQTDSVMLADTFPTGYHATEMAGVKPGDQTVIMGGGPVGLMAAYSATIKGASRPVHRQDRLRRGVHSPGPRGREAQGEIGELEAQGKLPLDFGMMWFKGQSVGTGQCPVKKYNRWLRDLVAGEKARPGFLVAHEMPLDQAAEAYEHFDNRDNGYIKIVPHP
jgi:threonine dehydrogenase-like Zn-dependent dehydrogenase